MRRARALAAFSLAVALVLAACGSGSASTSGEAIGPAPGVRAKPGEIIVGLDDAGTPFDRRLLGTNAPAWLSPPTLADPNVVQRMKQLGVTVVRMPGGGWSDGYDWLACEQDHAPGCQWNWASTPTDYVRFLKATGAGGMWTFNVNGTAQEAAALVAFFNGSVDDDRVIGVDRNGKDWKTVGTWAQLRADRGDPAPQRVDYWEIGNEVYGAKPSAPGCLSYGWEDSYTCDGGDYMNGDADHDGFIKIRTAMLAIDPDITVGAVGIGGDQSGWGNFGNEVLDAGADAMDFYVVHDYGFSETRPERQALARATDAIPGVMDGAAKALAGHVSGRTVPIAVTEYNLYANREADSSAMMSRVVGSLYLADAIGQMALNGVSIATQWDMIDGDYGTFGNYGLIAPGTSDPLPQFYAMLLWSRMGAELVPISIGFDRDSALSAYASTSADGRVSLLVINKSTEEKTATIHLDGGAASYRAAQDVAAGEKLDAKSMTFNGSSTLPMTTPDAPAHDLGVVSAASFTHSFEPLSITRIALAPMPAAASASSTPPATAAS